MPAKRFLNTLSEYFYFTRGQRMALFIVAVLLVVVIGFRYYILAKSYPKTTAADEALLTTITEWKQYHRDSSNEKDLTDREKASWRIPDGQPLTQRKWILHPFDPNTAEADELLAMGFRPKSIETLIKYRNRGGRFKQPDDILKLYGLFPDEKEKILPYVRIAEVARDSSRFAANNFTRKKKNPVVVMINGADTAQWKALPGIGEKLSLRIVNFRQALGGFSSVEQVGETYALPDSTFQKIKPMLQFDVVDLRKLNINDATYEQLNAHPYISPKQARFIVNYRQQHKTIAHANALLETPELFDSKWYDKTLPYLEW